MPTMEEEFDEFSDIIIVAMQAWRGFEKKSAQLVKAFNDFSASHKYDAGADIAKGGKAMHPGTDIGIYSDLDAIIEEADQSLERYMLAIHAMKAAIDKAAQQITEENNGPTAFTILHTRELVESTLAQATATKSTWDEGLSAAMRAYGKFKLLSAKQRPLR